MPDRKDLPFLLTLLEDDSYDVRTSVVEALRSFGPVLDSVVAPYRRELPAESRSILDLLCSDLRQNRYGGDWLAWIEMEESNEALEQALIQIAVMEYGRSAYNLSDHLDELAARFLAWTPVCDPAHLMDFLFAHMQFRPPRDSASSHLYDNLCYVLEHRQGSQVALSCIAILTGMRAGITLHGISIQGNFMAISLEKQDMQMYNAFNKGKPLARASVLYIEEAFRRNRIAPGDMRARVHEVVLQVLDNAIAIHQRKGRHLSAGEYTELRDRLKEELRLRGRV
ncbi:MAG: hypothetical protein EAZ89_17355 [Bacteroidetes bacterium]|nr:MAG: hypothetical protein EAZ89_17355 [Bacteroidota bacterium]